MNLKQLFLIEGKSYRNYFKDKVKGKYSTWYGLADPNRFQEFKSEMKIADPTSTDENIGGYADWIVRELKRKLKNSPMGRPRNTDMVISYLNMIGHFLEYFHNNKKAFKYQDIYKYTIDDIIKEKSKIEDKKATRKIKGAKTTFEHGNWKIVEIKNHQMACNIGAGSKWCITMKQVPNEFSYYKKFGPIFFVVKGNRRWAITGNPSKTIFFNAWDEKDNAKLGKEWKKDENVPFEVYKYLLGRYMK